MEKHCADFFHNEEIKGKGKEIHIGFEPEYSVTYIEPKILSILFHGAMLFLLYHYCYNFTTLLVKNIKEVSRKSVQKIKGYARYIHYLLLRY